MESDNTCYLMVGEAMAAHDLGKISVDLVEKPTFVFRTFGRKSDCKPQLVQIGPDPTDATRPLVTIDDTGYRLTDPAGNSLSDLLKPPASFKS